MLRVSGVHTFYGNIEALRGVDLRVDEGEIVTLIGANGAGKSTLLMTICGQPRASRGRIEFEGEDITRWPTHKIIAAGIAQSPEGRRIFPRMSVLENLLMGGTAGDSRHLDEDLARVFTLFPILEQRSDQRGGTLSGGEQQMLAIGRALMSRPRLLLLDEPSLGLAPIIIRDLFAKFDELNELEGVTMFVVEQNANVALDIADRAYVLEAGRIVLTGQAVDLRADDAVRRAYLGF
jgi:branched-chain amino acid transport system ATP-binding protein